MSSDDATKVEDVVDSTSKEKDDQLEVSEQKIIPPDSKHGWVVVFGSFLAHYVALGSMYTFGVFVVPLRFLSNNLLLNRVVNILELDEELFRGLEALLQEL